MFNDCLIMAGGSGSRLWPASSSQKPKQFLSAADGGSFFSLALERALAVTGGTDGRVIVIAGKSHMPHVIKNCAVLAAADKKRLVLIPEPEAKNTAPAIACAVTYSLLCGGPVRGGQDRTMLVLTSDHIIKPLEAFKANAEAAEAFAAKERLVVFGIPPARPETGYGYIETGKRIARGVQAVTAFREKPDLRTAKQFIASRRFFWNSGMFAFSTQFMTACFRHLAPDIIGLFEKLKKPEAGAYTRKLGLGVLNAWAGLEAAYRKTKNISFDYAVAERCGQTVMIRAGFDWIDVGNWEEYSKLLHGSAGSEVFYSGEGGCSCFVDSDIPVALAGVEDLIVVIRTGADGSPQAALITRKGQTQRVREITEQIKKAGRTGLL